MAQRQSLCPSLARAWTTALAAGIPDARRVLFVLLIKHW